MNEPTQKWGSLISLIVLVGASLFYNFLNQLSIDSARPPENLQAQDRGNSCQLYPSRLWQDPFESLEKATNQPVDRLTTAISNCLGATLHVLLVNMEGSPYPDDKEVRRRIRYSVELALLMSGLTPEDRSHIGIDQFPPGNTSNCATAYEWFECPPANTNQERLLLVWLNENRLGSNPWLMLNNVYKYCLQARGTNTKNALDFRMIGPRTSDTLRFLANPTPTPPDRELLKHFKIYSCEATAPDSQIWATDPVVQTNWSTAAQVTNEMSRAITRYKLRQLRENNADDQFSQTCTNEILENWIANDWQLGQKLVAEIGNRGEQTGINSNEVIVLVSEADTQYGRSLPQTFQHAFTNLYPRMTGNLIKYQYLRGLDGVKAPKSDERYKSQPEVSPEAKLIESMQSEGEKAEGEPQLDYAERLAEELSKLNQERRQKNGGGIKAVGLLGSDLYDKFILLQALRSKLDGAIFFTTDLDARMWTPGKNLAFTRNLLVASSYAVNTEITNDSRSLHLPFRDGYQTAIFAATRGAIKQLMGRPPGSTDDSKELTGQLYKIGANGPVELDSSEQNGTPPAIFFYIMIGLYYVGKVSLVFLVLWLVYRGHWHPLPYFNKSPWSRLAVLAVLTGVVAGIYLFYDWVDGRSYPVRLPMALMIVIFGLTFLVMELTVGFKYCTHPEPDHLVNLDLLTTAAPPTEVSDKPRAIWDLPWPNVGLTMLVLLVLVVIIGLFAYAVYMVSQIKREEPCVFSGGVSIWLTETLRLLAALLSLLFLFVTKRRHESHRLEMWHRFANKGISGEQIRKFLKSNPITHLSWSEIKKILISHWVAPQWQGEKREAYQDGDAKIDATHLIGSYLVRGRYRNRLIRAAIIAAIFALIACMFISLLRQFPGINCIRGQYSAAFDRVMLGLSVSLFLALLFFCIDSARLAAKLLKFLSSYHTKWSDEVLADRCKKTGLRPDDLDGVIDMEFALFKCKETQSITYFPFIILLLLILSRDHRLDSWPWTWGLECIFIFNFFLVAVCWSSVRHSATKLREYSVRRLNEKVHAVRGQVAEMVEIKPFAADSVIFTYKAEDYAKRLEVEINRMEMENRGVFSPWMQDPTYFALFIPTGITGLIAIFVQYWVSR